MKNDCSNLPGPSILLKFSQIVAKRKEREVKKFGSHNASTNAQQDGNDDDSDTADDDNISDGSCGFDPAKVHELDNLNITTPGLAKSSTRVRPASQATEKQSHCKKCGHIVKGHKRPANEPPKCPLCPNNLCCDNGGGNECSCEWHKPLSPQDILVNQETSSCVLRQ